MSGKKGGSGFDFESLIRLSGGGSDSSYCMTSSLPFKGADKPSYTPPPKMQKPVKVGVWAGAGAGAGGAVGMGVGSARRVTTEARTEPAASTLGGAAAGAYVGAKLARDLNAGITGRNLEAAREHYRSPEVMAAKKEVDSAARDEKPIDATAFKTVVDATNTLRKAREEATKASKKSSSWWPF